MVLALFIALPCWSRGSSSGSGAASSSNWRYQKGGPIAETPVTISVLTHSGHAPNLAIPNNNLPVFATMMRRLGINVDWQILERATYDETVTVRLMSRNLPDIVVLLQQSVISQMVEDGAFQAYTDLNWQENAPYTQELFKEVDYAPLEKVYRNLYGDGKIYGFGDAVIPRFLSNPNHIVNMVWLKNLGLPEPSTLDEFYNMLVAFRDNDPNKNGRRDEIPFAFSDVNSINLAFAGTFGLNFNYGWELDRNGRVTSIYTTDKFRNYLEFRKRMYDNDLIDKESRDMTQYFELVAADRLGVFPFWPSYQGIGNYSPYYDEKEDNIVFRELLPLRNVTSGNREIFARLDASITEPMLILKGARYPEVCLRFIDWLWASPEYEMLMNFGIEGLSYNMVNGRPVPIRPANYTGSMDYINYIGGSQPPWAHRQSEYAWHFVDWNKPWMDERATAMKPYYVDGLMPAVLSVSDYAIVTRYQPDVLTFINEMTDNFITGRRPLSQFNQFVQEVNNLGLDRMREVYQKYH